jgi:hypothetical protein
MSALSFGGSELASAWILDSRETRDVQEIRAEQDLKLRFYG